MLESIDLTNYLVKIILPVTGILIILFCIGAYFFRYGSNLKDNIQEFKLFGADLRVSIITVFVLIGLIFIFAGTYLSTVDTNSKLVTQLGEKDKIIRGIDSNLKVLQGQYENLRTIQNKSLGFYLDLEGEDAPPEIKNLKIFYTVFTASGAESRPLAATVINDLDPPRLKVIISNLTENTFVQSLVVQDLQSNKKWKTGGFFPLSPSLSLKHQ